MLEELSTNSLNDGIELVSSPPDADTIPSPNPNPNPDPSPKPNPDPNPKRKPNSNPDPNQADHIDVDEALRELNEIQGERDPSKPGWVPQPLSSAWACCVQARTKAPLPYVGGCLDRTHGHGKGPGGAPPPGRGGAGKGGGGGGAVPRGAAAKNGHPGGGKPTGVGKPPGKPGGGLASQMAQQKPCAACTMRLPCTPHTRLLKCTCTAHAPHMHRTCTAHAPHMLHMHVHVPCVHRRSRVRRPACPLAPRSKHAEHSALLIGWRSARS